MDYCLVHGIDLLDMQPMAFKVFEQDQQFFEKLFTPTEILYCQKKDGDINRALSFAARLAAKGAVAKMLGANYEVVAFKDIEVINDDLGKPYVKLRGKALERAVELGINQENIALSISHTDELVIASAVALVQNKNSKQKGGERW